MKFDPTFNGFNGGAMEVFSIVVTGFNPNTTIQVQGKAGNATDTLNFLLSTLCPPSAPTQATRPFTGFKEWLSGSWNSLMNWLAPQAITPATQSRGGTNYLQQRSGSNVYVLALPRDGPLNWKSLKESSSQHAEEASR